MLNERETERTVIMRSPWVRSRLRIISLQVLVLAGLVSIGAFKTIGAAVRTLSRIYLSRLPSHRSMFYLCLPMRCVVMTVAKSQTKLTCQ